ncbi:MAG: hypothetical protein GY822_18070 [Deltaproteobacteria bacterium]|nr:hypothetical protein [Deltaproteobacteria bacterium]
MSLRDHLTPTLFGETLAVLADGQLAFVGGKSLANEQLLDVLYLSDEELENHVQQNREQQNKEVSEEKAWFSGLPPLVGASDDSLGTATDVGDDVALLLAGISSSTSIAPPKVEIDAGFFHLSLLRWLGLLDNDQDELAARWSYDFWRADVTPLEAVQAPEVPAGAQVYEATVYANDAFDEGELESDEPHRDAQAYQAHRYFVLFDDEEHIVNAGWLSAPPDLLESEQGGKRSSTFSLLPTTSEEVWQQTLFDGDDGF